MTPRPTVRTLSLFVLTVVTVARLYGDTLETQPEVFALPFEIEINGSSHGEVIARASPSLDIVELEGSSLQDLLKGIVAMDLLSLVEALPVGFHKIDTYRDIGLDIRLDLERLVIVLQIQERRIYENVGPQNIYLGYQRVLNYDAHEEEARFSGYVNFRLRATHEESGDRTPKTSYNLSASHVLNFGGYALEGESLISEKQGFQTKELRLVRDLPQRLLRFSAGDISTPINEFQRGYQLLGLNLSREFGIQPYRTFTPTSSASFDLKEPSTVSVVINGRHARTLSLDPGSYNIEEFKLAAGQNQMELRFKGESGLVDTMNVNEFGAPNLLDSGVHTYSISAGFPRSTVENEDALHLGGSSVFERYLQREPIISGYYRRGISNQFTFSTDLQGNASWSRFGLAAHTASERFGSLNLSASQNTVTDGYSAPSVRLNWARDLYGFNLNISHLYSGFGYNSTGIGNQNLLRDTKNSTSLSLNRRFDGKLNTSLSVLSQRKQDGSDIVTINAQIGRRIGPAYSSLTFRYNEQPLAEDFSTFLSITWSPKKKWRARSQIRSSSLPGGSSITTQIDYASRHLNRFTNARLSASQSDSGYQWEGSLVRQTAMYSVELSHNQIFDSLDGYLESGQQTNLSFESAIAFADGAVGFADRIRDSFAIVSKHSAWSEVELGINRRLGGFEHRNRSMLFSPVISHLNSYNETYANIQTVDSDLFLDRNDYYFFPSYKRGTRLKIGSDAIYSLRGTLLYSDGEPVQFKAIQLIGEDGSKHNTFTNGAGRFIAMELRPGRYRVTVAATSETASIEIETGDTSLFIGEVQLSRPASQ